MLFNRYSASIKKNLRYKLLLLVLMPVFIFMPITLGLAAYWSQNFSYEQLYMKVNTDLSVTHEAFHQQQIKYLGIMERVSESYTFRSSLYEKDLESLNLELEILNEEGRFDFLHLLSVKGDWKFESSYLGYTHSKHSVLFRDAGLGKSVSGVEIFTQDDLKREKSIDRTMMRLSLVDTPHAKPIRQKVEDRGMLLRMVVPVYGVSNEVIALLDGGVLLNRNFNFVDNIRDLVYGPGSLIEGSLGAVTVFLDDIRITTNVPIKSGGRALGTRVSKEVRNKVLENGENWIDRAFVVNDWYISAYEPLYDVSGKRVGILYAGFLETPFSKLHRNALLILIALFVLVLLLSSWYAIRGAKSIFRPIEQMTSVVRGTQAGQQLRIGDVDSDDEIGELARQFDSMLDQLQEHNLQIVNAAEILEHKVDERTAELQTKNEALKDNINLLNETRKQLVLAEKLASLGELTAGIAHEINNPTAVILGNMELILSEMEGKMEPVKFETELIIEQVYRIRNIIDSLLEYSRTGGTLDQIEPVNINSLIEHALLLVKYEMETHHIDISLNLNADIFIGIRKEELQQVLINLIVNSIQSTYTDEFNKLTIETKNWESKGVVINIKDNGVGIAEEVMANVFDPFYTTKQNGTGLGLSVSFGLVQRYGGTITVDNNPEGGACFSIWLLHKPEVIELKEEQECSHNLSYDV